MSISFSLFGKYGKKRDTQIDKKTQNWAVFLFPGDCSYDRTV